MEICSCCFELAQKKKRVEESAKEVLPAWNCCSRLIADSSSFRNAQFSPVMIHLIVHAILLETVCDMVVIVDSVYSTPVVTLSEMILGLQNNQRILQQLRILGAYADAGMTEHVKGLRQFYAIHLNWKSQEHAFPAEMSKLYFSNVTYRNVEQLR